MVDAKSPLCYYNHYLGRSENTLNYRLDIQYDGTRYGGWQKQKDTDNTIQGKIEDVLSRMCETPVTIQGAGRTDAGVINGHIFTAEDCGGAIKDNRIDIYVNDHEKANALGVNYADVYLLK